MKTITNKFKIALAAVGLLAVGTVSAQTTDPSDNVAQSDAAGETIRLIDNKGTIKYLQSNNGITTITSTETGNRTTTTWQLGGTLTDATYIDASGAIFALDGLALETGAASTDATPGSTHTTATGTGWTLLVRDEASGETRKMLFSSLIEEAHDEYTAVVGDETANSIEITLAFRPSEIGKLLIFRNGAKLRAGEDYDFKDVAGSADELVVVLTGAALAANQQWDIYTGDVFEYNYSK